MLTVHFHRSSVFFSAAVAAFLSFTILEAGADNFREAIRLHDAAWSGDGSSLEPAIEMLQDILGKQPYNPLVMAYFGSAYAISARDSWNIITKSRHGNKGLEFLDKALEYAPDDFTVRVLRARVQLAMPRFLGRRDEAIEDLIVMERIFRGNPNPETAGIMLEFYGILMEEAPDRGNWKVGYGIAQSLTD